MAHPTFYGFLIILLIFPKITLGSPIYFSMYNPITRSYLCHHGTLTPCIFVQQVNFAILQQSLQHSWGLDPNANICQLPQSNQSIDNEQSTVHNEPPCQTSTQNSCDSVDAAVSQEVLEEALESLRTCVVSSRDQIIGRLDSCFQEMKLEEKVPSVIHEEPDVDSAPSKSFACAQSLIAIQALRLQSLQDENCATVNGLKEEIENLSRENEERLQKIERLSGEIENQKEIIKGLQCENKYKDRLLRELEFQLGTEIQSSQIVCRLSTCEISDEPSASIEQTVTIGQLLIEKINGLKLTKFEEKKDCDKCANQSRAGGSLKPSDQKPAEIKKSISSSSACKKCCQHLKSQWEKLIKEQNSVEDAKLEIAIQQRKADTFKDKNTRMEVALKAEKEKVLSLLISIDDSKTKMSWEEKNLQEKTRMFEEQFISLQHALKAFEVKYHFISRASDDQGRISKVHDDIYELFDGILMYQLSSGEALPFTCNCVTKSDLKAIESLICQKSIKNKIWDNGVFFRFAIYVYLTYALLDFFGFIPK